MRNISSFIFNALICLIIMQIWGCSVVKPVLPKEEIHYTYKDSTIINVIDSIKYIPVEKIVDVVPDYDTLKLETSLAKASAFVDTTTHTLKGNIQNKKDVEQKIKYVYKEKIKTDTTYIKVPVPVEVEKIVHKHYWYESILWFLSILFVGIIGLKIFFKKL